MDFRADPWLAVGRVEASGYPPTPLVGTFVGSRPKTGQIIHEISHHWQIIRRNMATIANVYL